MTDPLHDSAGQQVLPVDLTHVGSTALTGRDITADLQVLTDLKKGALNADDLTAETANVLKAISHLYGYDGTTFDRIRAALNSGSINLHNFSGMVAQAVLHARLDGETTKELDARTTDLDNLAAGLVGLITMSHLYGFDGTTWDRIRAALNSGSINLHNFSGMVAQAVLHARIDASTTKELDARTTDLDNVAAGLNALVTMSHLYGYDGTAWDRIRAALTTDTINLHNLSALVTASVLHGRQDGETVSPITAVASADGAGIAGLIALLTIAEQCLYNDSTWDRARNNWEDTILGSAARVADAASADQVNYNHRGVVLFVDVSAVVGDDTVKIVVEGKDPISGGYYVIFTGAELGTTGLRVYEIHPEAAVASEGVTAVSARILPRTWRATLDYTQVTGVADEITASVAASYVP